MREDGESVIHGLCHSGPRVYFVWFVYFTFLNLNRPYLICKTFFTFYATFIIISARYWVVNNLLIYI